MSELNLAPPSESGKGKAIAIAAVVMIVIAAAVYFMTPHEVMHLSVTHEDLVAPHIEEKSSFGGGGIQVVDSQKSYENSLYAVETLHVENKRSEPLYLTGITATATYADGTEGEATVVTPQDFGRIEPSFPELTPLLAHPLALDATIPAKGTVDGAVLLLFPQQTKVSWAAKRDLKITLLLAHGAPQTVTVK